MPMYDWAEAHEETDNEWKIIRDALRSEGLDAPEHLVRKNANLPPLPDEARNDDDSAPPYDPQRLPPDELDLMAVWRHPQLLLAQTCWGPMEQGLEQHVIVVGQPDYSRFEGGQGPLYSSAILMRRGSNPNVSPPTLQALTPYIQNKRLAFNSSDSMSGFLALSRDLQALDSSLAIFTEMVETGGHRASIRAAADGKADVCAVDCRTWDLAKRFEEKAGQVEVVGWTGLRKGLPYITSKETKGQVVEKLRKVFADLGMEWDVDRG